MRLCLAFKVSSATCLLFASFICFARPSATTGGESCQKDLDKYAGSLLQLSSVRNQGSPSSLTHPEQLQGLRDARSEFTSSADDLRRLEETERRHFEQLQGLLSARRDAALRAAFDFRSREVADARADGAAKATFEQYLPQASAAVTEAGAAREAFKTWAYQDPGERMPLDFNIARANDAVDPLRVASHRLKASELFASSAQPQPESAPAAPLPVLGKPSDAQAQSWLGHMVGIDQEAASNLSSLAKIIQAPAFMVVAAVVLAGSGIALLSAGRFAHRDVFDDSKIFSKPFAKKTGTGSLFVSSLRPTRFRHPPQTAGGSFQQPIPVASGSSLSLHGWHADDVDTMLQGGTEVEPDYPVSMALPHLRLPVPEGGMPVDAIRIPRNSRPHLVASQCPDLRGRAISPAMKKQAADLQWLCRLYLETREQIFAFHEGRETESVVCWLLREELDVVRFKCLLDEALDVPIGSSPPRRLIRALRAVIRRALHGRKCNAYGHEVHRRFVACCSGYDDSCSFVYSAVPKALQLAAKIVEEDQDAADAGASLQDDIANWIPAISSQDPWAESADEDWGQVIA